MNRSALCIKMLNLLNSRGKMSRDELAKELETNKRNIGEFKKELETAGYVINSTSGKDGGYELVREKLFPAVNLNGVEINSIDEALGFLKNSKFLDYDNFQSAMDKVKSTVNNYEISGSGKTYFLKSNYFISEEIIKRRDLLKKAMEERKCVSMMYSKLDDDDFSERIIQPYEIIEYRSGVYVLAYDITKGKEKRFKTFKINKQRMAEICILDQRFTRDADFKITDYIGETGLFKEIHKVVIEVSGNSGKNLSEREIGIASNIEKVGDKFICEAIFDNEIARKSFVLSLGGNCKVISPQDFKEEIKEELMSTLELYKNNDVL